MTVVIRLSDKIAAFDEKGPGSAPFFPQKARFHRKPFKQMMKNREITLNKAGGG